MRTERGVDNPGPTYLHMAVALSPRTHLPLPSIFKTYIPLPSKNPVQSIFHLYLIVHPRKSSAIKQSENSGKAQHDERRPYSHTALEAVVRTDQQPTAPTADADLPGSRLR